jgi:hypothetical protein
MFLPIMFLMTSAVALTEEIKRKPINAYGAKTAGELAIAVNPDAIIIELHGCTGFGNKK